MQWLVALAGAALMAACGGDGDGGCSLYTGGSGNSCGSTAPTAANLIIALDKSSVANTGSDNVVATITATDANNNTVSGAGVLVTADAGAVVASSAATTGTDGKLTATVSIGADRSNRTITITAKSGSVTNTATFQVSGARLTGTLVPAVVAPGAGGQVQYRLVDQSGSPMANQSITVTAAGLTPPEVTASTGTNGEYVYAYTAPATSGSFTVTASAGGVGDSQSVQVQTVSTIPPVTATITSASVSANPSVVGVNTTSAPTANRSEIRALFLGANNLPIPNVRVRFDLDSDVNSIGGTFSTDTSMVYSDANGLALSSYIPGTRSSPTKGLTVRACYSETDFAVGACPNWTTVALTVTAEPLGVSIGTNALISSTNDNLLYVKKFIVQVVDSAGRAKADVDLAVSVDLPRFRKGSYIAGTDGWIQNETSVCDSEDVNRNGVLEAGEDINGNGSLQPGKSDVSVMLLQTKTRADGTAELQIQYPQSFGSWVDAVVTVSASGVLGTEGRTTAVVAPVPVDATSVKNKDVPPAFVTSPYGIQAGCANPN
ncbi:carboxypeptidase-like regulatory domain-containing protein [Rivibacter subsaxonicus]|uniref:Big-1 domain-containing protein n=1 Tax=Rivibacter subsaxonicus TaxID=457575 RepID=A0A4Q7VGF8_9BURK|nr:carboxypeptidase-like regulatory domain-containing protein [Rivibacter subsaxonicus]RZT95116.1 hypothetical protein EV670_2864 [Rivibacter subsaxonicus]